MCLQEAVLQQRLDEVRLDPSVPKTSTIDYFHRASTGEGQISETFHDPLMDFVDNPYHPFVNEVVRDPADPVSPQVPCETQVSSKVP
jgi:hypothetical protein